MKPCDICIEETCGGARDCDCSTCTKASECPRVLWPTVRITTKCTQSCNHCCFSCSPKAQDFMSVETAGILKKFLAANQIKLLTLMGGEFFCHPQWQDLFEILIPGLNYVRLVSNGDWAGTARAKDIMGFLTRFANLKVSLSYDKWHTNRHIKKAQRLLDHYSLRYNVAEGEDSEDFAIVPVGRGEFISGLYSTFGTYCSNPDKHYHFLIDEAGLVYKCGFGVWDYARITTYQDGGFAKKFKKFNQLFYKTFIPNCQRCQMSYHFAPKRKP